MFSCTRNRSDKEWREGRSAVNNQIKPRNVFSFTAGLNDVATHFTNYLRLESTTLANTRLLQEDTTLMGYHIPAKTSVWYLSCVAGKDEQLFPNPERFDPVRWTRDKPNPFAILPFGFGPRTCYGKRFAELELKLILCQSP